MSKGIDYSKFDHIGEDDDGDDDSNGASGGMSARSFEMGQQMRSILEGMSVKDGVMSFTPKDFCTASKLLSMVTPDGIKERAEAAATHEELEEDPVLVNLWELTMKVRVNAAQVDELMRVNAIDRLLSVIDKCNLVQQYKTGREISQVAFQAVAISSKDISEMPTAGLEEKQNAKKLMFDIKDTHYSISVLHRYRSGCVAVAEHKSCLVKLFSIPFDYMIVHSMQYCLMKFDQAESGKSREQDPDANPMDVFGEDLSELANYCWGQIEQSIIDTFGRLLNGLDQHDALRRKVSSFMATQIDSFESKMHISAYMIDLATEKFGPAVGHCVKLKSSLSKLRQMISNPGGKHKAWRSTFRIERHHLPQENEQNSSSNAESSSSSKQTNDGTERMCHFCATCKFDLKTCSRCRTVSYCSRQCQVNDWKKHKMNCVEQRGFSTESDWTSGDYYKWIQRSHAEKQNQDTKK